MDYMRATSRTSSRMWHGLAAGFVATVVLSALMLMKSAMGMMPELNPIQMIAKMGSSYLGLPLTPAIGWLMHFLIGTVLWGVLFAVLESSLPGNALWVRGALFSIGAWLLMMIIMMPLAGAGLFGLALGMLAPIATLVLHLVFGVVLGAIYGWLERQGHQPARA